MRAIVLSGGGAKGSYEIGVWKAIRKLNIDYDIVTGTSVGALNGALMVQKDYIKALFLWYNLKYDDVFKIKEDYSLEEIKKFYKDEILKGGIDVTNLEKTVKKLINKKKFFKSNIKYGLITVRFPSLKHMEMTKDNLNEDNLVDYLIASASCFPAFKLKEIDSKLYLDGGFYDNMPINLAVKLGATEVIAVDLDEIGIKRKVKYDIDVTYITPKNKIDSFLKFEKNSARRGMRLGYNDTMKKYGKLDGDKYTFKLNHLISNFKKYEKKFIDNIDKIKPNELILKNITLKKIYSSKQTYYKKFNNIIEKSGYAFLIDDSYIYDIRKFNRNLIKNFNKIKINQKQIEENLRNNKIKTLLNTTNIIKYLYYLIENKDYKKLNKLCLLFPNEFLVANYIKTIKG
ncbi:MAG: patatin-like phospholipase family protein [Bacilli bacterium]|nr:patatin-like phospholipase family protein [Bacilli bacterium]